MTQVLTGHGCFAAYKIQDSERCARCGFAPDDAEHGFFACDAWENWRRRTCAELGVDAISPDNLVDVMLTSPLNWKLVSQLITKIMTERESEERARQGLPGP